MIALTPQMLVPTAINVPNRFGNPIQRVINVTDTIATVMQPIITGSATSTSCPTVTIDSVNPITTMPMRRIVRKQSFNPGSYSFGTPTVLRTSRPSATAIVTGLTGLAPGTDPARLPTRSARMDPPHASANASVTPGSITPSQPSAS